MSELLVSLSPHQARILEAQIQDGASTPVVAERARVGRNVANRVLSEIAGLCGGVPRMEMVVGFITGRFKYRLR